MSQNTVVTTFEGIQQRFVVWAWSRDDVRAGFVVGSRASVDRPADEWSDIDIVVVAGDPEQLLSSTDWLAEIGTPWLSFIDTTELGGRLQRRVLFEGAINVDFILIPMSLIDDIAEFGMPAETATVVRRGARVLFDKDNIAGRLQAPLQRAALPPFLPPMEEVSELFGDFWYHVVWSIKRLMRGEVLAAKNACDGHLKGLLLTLIEWHARAGSDLRRDTWSDGRFFEQWADPRAVDGMRASFARYDADDVRRALLETIALFRWLARETTERLGYPYPAETDANVSAWVARTLGE